MKISVFGMGYVGTVSCGCLAKNGHNVTGVDVSREKVKLINGGRSPVIEKDIGKIIKEAKNAGQLGATQNTDKAVLDSEISFICVGTPSRPNGSIDLCYIKNV